MLTRGRGIGVGLIGVVAVAMGAAARGDDWSHYRGPKFDGVSAEKGWVDKWPDDGPKRLWKTNVGIGAASVTVVEGKVFTTGNVGGAKDVVWCLDAATGKPLWEPYKYPSQLERRNFEGGTAATPTVDNGMVYALGPRGLLLCLDAATGDRKWDRMLKDMGGAIPQFEYAGSPLIEDNMVILDAGGNSKGGASTLALNKTTGDVIWRSGDDGAGYASPVAGTIDGKRTIVMFKSDTLVGLDAGDGHELWRYPWETQYNINAPTPTIIGGEIFITSGYGRGCALLEVKGGKVISKWENKSLASQLGTPAVYQGYIYGFTGDVNQKENAALVCLEWKTGATKWKKSGLGAGTLMIADGKLVILSESGELVIAPASPNGFTATSQTQALGGTCWVMPVLANGHIYARNNNGDLVCLDVSTPAKK